MLCSWLNDALTLELVDELHLGVGGACSAPDRSRRFDFSTLAADRLDHVLPRYEVVSKTL